MEYTLLWLEEQVVLHCKFQYFSYTFDVILQVGAGRNRYVVHVFANFGAQWFPFVDDRPKIQSIIA